MYVYVYCVRCVCMYFVISLFRDVFLCLVVYFFVYVVRCFFISSVISLVPSLVL